MTIAYKVLHYFLYNVGCQDQLTDFIQTFYTLDMKQFASNFQYVCIFIFILLSTNLKCVYIAFYNYSFFPHYAMLFYGDEG